MHESIHDLLMDNTSPKFGKWLAAQIERGHVSVYSTPHMAQLEIETTAGVFLFEGKKAFSWSDDKGLKEAAHKAQSWWEAEEWNVEI